MIIGVFCEAEFDRANETLSGIITIKMHIPTLRNQPILKVVQSDIANQIGEQPFAYL